MLASIELGGCVAKCTRDAILVEIFNASVGVGGFDADAESLFIVAATSGNLEVVGGDIVSKVEVDAKVVETVDAKVEG